jgi:hypothetical protein
LLNPYRIYLLYLFPCKNRSFPRALKINQFHIWSGNNPIIRRNLKRANIFYQKNPFQAEQYIKTQNKERFTEPISK